MLEVYGCSRGMATPTITVSNSCPADLHAVKRELSGGCPPRRSALLHADESTSRLPLRQQPVVFSHLISSHFLFSQHEGLILQTKENFLFEPRHSGFHPSNVAIYCYLAEVAKLRLGGHMWPDELFNSPRRSRTVISP